MVVAYHSIFTAYGFWLPNDPRGSWSDYIRRYELLQFGNATKTIERRSHAHDEHDDALRTSAKDALRYSPVVFNGVQARSIARGFAKAVERTGCTIHACAIMPDHVHMVIARHHYDVEQLIGRLKSDATHRLCLDGLHPLAWCAAPGGVVPSPWVRKGWNVYLNNADQVYRAIDYVSENPVRAGYKAQSSWSFVMPFRG